MDTAIGTVHEKEFMRMVYMGDVQELSEYVKINKIEPEWVNTAFAGCCVLSLTPQLRYLISIGAQVSSLDHTPILIAANKRDWPLCLFLLDNGAHIEAHSGVLLQRACEAGDEEMVTSLIARGADIDCDHGEPLILACQYNHPHLVRLLIESGVDVHASKRGALSVAIDLNHYKIVDDLKVAIRNVSEISSVKAAAEKGDTGRVEDFFSETPMNLSTATEVACSAAEAGQLDVVDYITSKMKLH